jgi:hypothetical protein
VQQLADVRQVGVVAAAGASDDAEVLVGPVPDDEPHDRAHAFTADVLGQPAGHAGHLLGESL